MNCLICLFALRFKALVEVELIHIEPKVSEISCGRAGNSYHIETESAILLYSLSVEAAMLVVTANFSVAVFVINRDNINHIIRCNIGVVVVGRGCILIQNRVNRGHM